MSQEYHVYVEKNKFRVDCIGLYGYDVDMEFYTLIKSNPDTPISDLMDAMEAEAWKNAYADVFCGRLDEDDDPGSAAEFADQVLLESMDRDMADELV